VDWDNGFSWLDLESCIHQPAGALAQGPRLNLLRCNDHHGIRAEAFGAVWHGSIARKYSDKQWTFDLSADHLDAAEMDRWLGPRARPGFLARFTGSNSAVSAAPLADGVVTRLAARGRFRAGVIDVPPMQIEQLDGEVELAGRTIRFARPRPDFFGGKISGSFRRAAIVRPLLRVSGQLRPCGPCGVGRRRAFLEQPSRRKRFRRAHPVCSRHWTARIWLARCKAGNADGAKCRADRP